jgi:hypothetical protein
LYERYREPLCKRNYPRGSRESWGSIAKISTLNTAGCHHTTKQKGKALNFRVTTREVSRQPGPQVRRRGSSENYGDFLSRAAKRRDQDGKNPEKVK